MKEKRIFSIAEEHKPIVGCTTSEALLQGSMCSMSVFSIAAETNISPETYNYPKLWKIEQGSADVIYLSEHTQPLQYGEVFVVPENIPVGIQSSGGCIYSEIIFNKECSMNKILKGGELFVLKELLPYKEANIVSMDLVDNKKTKFVLMSFDAGTELQPHAAPGEAIVFGLDGEAIIGYEGKEYRIHEGENFKFDKDGRHYVKAVGKFKMALLLIRE